MISQEEMDLIECALSHDCPKNNLKRCAICEIDFHFVSDDPLQLSCSHSICQKCTKKGAVRCKHHGECTVGLEALSTEHLIKIKQNELFHQLKDKYIKTINLLETTKSESKNKLQNKIADIKYEVDHKIESLKDDLDKLKQSIHKELEEKEQAIIKENYDHDETASAKENLKSLYSYIDSSHTLDMDKFYTYQCELRKSIDDLQNFFDLPYKIQFRESSSEFEINDLVGKVDFELMKPKFHANWHNPFDIRKVNCIFKFEEHTDRVRNLSIIPSGLLVSCSWDKTMKVWNVDEGKCEKTLTEHKNDVTSLMVLSNDLMATGSWKEIKIWHTQTFHCIKTIKGHTHYIRCFEQFHDGPLVSGSQDKTIKFWDISHGTCLKTLAAHDDVVWCLQMLPNNLFASGSFDKTIKIWSHDKDSELMVLKGHFGHVYSLKLSPNNLLISGSQDGTIKFWNYENGQCMSFIDLHSSVHSLLFLPNELLACGLVQHIAIVRLSTQEVVLNFEAHDNLVDSLCLVNKHCFASGSYDCTIKIWKF